MNNIYELIKRKTTNIHSIVRKNSKNQFFVLYNKNLLSSGDIITEILDAHRNIYPTILLDIQRIKYVNPFKYTYKDELSELDVKGLCFREDMYDMLEEAYNNGEKFAIFLSHKDITSDMEEQIITGFQDILTTKLNNKNKITKNFKLFIIIDKEINNKKDGIIYGDI